MTLDQVKGDPSSISTDDQILIDAYQRVGIALDSLAYTEDFRKLAAQAGRDPEKESELRDLYRRLMALRKRAILPRLQGSAQVEP